MSPLMKFIDVEIGTLVFLPSSLPFVETASPRPAATSESSRVAVFLMLVAVISEFLITAVTFLELSE